MAEKDWNKIIKELKAEFILDGTEKPELTARLKYFVERGIGVLVEKGEVAEVIFMKKLSENDDKEMLRILAIALFEDLKKWGDYKPNAV